MLTELNKFEVIGPVHFHKGILPSHVAEFLSKNFSIFRKVHFLYKRKKLIY